VYPHHAPFHPSPPPPLAPPLHPTPTDPERAFGRESRSLKAIYELVEDGWNINNIRHVEGGFQQWRYQVTGGHSVLESGFCGVGGWVVRAEGVCVRSAVWVQTCTHWPSYRICLYGSSVEAPGLCCFCFQTQ
jgi:hypothetical protein